jgi:hypothetical protein
MSQYQISKKRLAEIIKEEYQNLHEYVDPRSPSPMTWEHEDMGSSFRKQVMNFVLRRVDMAVAPEKREKLVNDIKLAFDAAGIGGPVSTVANRKDEAKQAKKDYDGDGEVESSTEEWKGSRDKAIKKNKGKGKKEEDEEEDKEVKESLISLRKLIAQEIKNL